MVKIDDKADGNPTKGFFVRMITRDISLEDCILDLIDNSIDGAWKLEGGMPAGLSAKADLSKYSIIIEIEPKRFSISDNCGGISLNDAKNYAFTFGRKDTDDFENYSIGVYGIGMKRAVFKLGLKTTVTSTISTSSGLDAFKVSIDVREWLTRKDIRDWDFPITSANADKKAGVSIVVDSLTEGTATSFEDPAFVKRLRRIISRDYTIHLHYGLKIILNGRAISGWNIEMRTSSELTPQRSQYVDMVGEDPVSVEIVAGMAAPPPDESADADEIDDDDAYGWYVVCNGRVVLAADKGELSGWGTDGWPQWHGQYNGFIGLVIFTATNASLLPLTTTKRSVDVSSEVYRRARPKMRDVSRYWTAYTSLRKADLEEAKSKEAPAANLSIFSIPANSTFRLPTLTVAARPKNPNTRVSYTVEPKRFRELAIALGNVNMSRKELGLTTFDRVYDEEVGS